MNLNIYKDIEEYKQTKNANLRNKIIKMIKDVEKQLDLMKFEIQYVESESEYEEYRKGDTFFKIEERNPPVAFNTQALTIPLLIHLFCNHKNQLTAIDTATNLMKELWDQLRGGDYQKTKTGQTRFIVNTRFASHTLRKFGLLRSDDKRFYKKWELSLYGVLIAASIYKYDSYFEKHPFQQFPFWVIIRNFSDKLVEQNYYKKIISDLFSNEFKVHYFDLAERSFMKYIQLVDDVLKKCERKDSTVDYKMLKNNLRIIDSDNEVAKLNEAIEYEVPEGLKIFVLGKGLR